jgi:hypothetical protein
MADQILGNLVWKITGDTSALNTGIKSSEKTVKKFIGIVKKLGATIAASFVAQKVIQLGRTLIRTASAAEETRAKFQTTFQGISKQAESVAKNLSNSFGLSQKAAETLLSNTGDLLSGFNFTRKASLDLSNEVNKLAVDLASFTNIEGGAERASNALTKALLGERESVKLLGISILEEDVKAKIKSLEATGELTNETLRQKKAVATLRLAQEQSKNAIGDFARTSESFANQQRILRGRLEDLSVTLGNKLLPAATSIVSTISDLIKEEDDLFTTTDGLVRISKEYADITRTLADESKKLTKEEREKLIVRKEELALQFLDSLKNINEQYVKQIDIIKENTRLNADNLKTRNLTIEALTKNGKKIQELREQEAQGINVRSELNTAIRQQEILLRSAAISKESEIRKTRKITEAQEQLEKTYKLINFGLKEGILSRTQLASLDPLLIKGAEEFAEKNKEVADGTDSTNESTKEYVRTLGDFERELKEVTAAQFENAGKFREAADLRFQLIDDEQNAVEKSLEGQEGSEKELMAAREVFAKRRIQLSEETADKEKEIEKDKVETIIGFAMELANAFSSIADTVTNKRLENLEVERQAALEAAGVAEETELQRAERELAELDASATEEERIEKRKALTKAQINEDYEKRKAETEYKGALAGWGAQLAATIAQSALGVISAYSSTAAIPIVGPVLAPIAAGIAGVAGGAAIASVIAAKPQKPQFQEGINSVPFTQDATVHKGEMIVPKPFAQGVREGDISIGKGSGRPFIFQLVAQTGEVLREWIFEGTKNGEQKIADAGIVAI